MKTTIKKLFSSSPDIKTLQLFMSIIMVVIMTLQVVSPVYASALDDGPFGRFNDTIKQISGYLIQFLIFIGTVAFVVGMVKAGVLAQVGQQMGMAHMVSGEILNIVMGIILFILMLSIFEIAIWVINTASAGVKTNYSDFPVPGK